MTERDTGGAFAAPPYSFEHSGPVLVCGSAWTFPEDYAEARSRYPDAPAIAVNGAAAFVPAFALYSQHPLKFPRWISKRRKLPGGFTVHAAGRSHLRNNLGLEGDLSSVDHFWEGIASKGSSAWGARRLAAAMGFDLVILCGVPLSPGEYVGGVVGKVNQRQSAMDGYRQAVLDDTDMHTGVISMSGWTREIFGAL
jgi:hypothetical protein